MFTVHNNTLSCSIEQIVCRSQQRKNILCLNYTKSCMYPTIDVGVFEKLCSRFTIIKEKSKYMLWENLINNYFKRNVINNYTSVYTSALTEIPALFLLLFLLSIFSSAFHYTFIYLLLSSHLQIVLHVFLSVVLSVSPHTFATVFLSFFPFIHYIFRTFFVS